MTCNGQYSIECPPLAPIRSPGHRKRSSPQHPDLLFISFTSVMSQSISQVYINSKTEEAALKKTYNVMVCDAAVNLRTSTLIFSIWNLNVRAGWRSRMLMACDVHRLLPQSAARNSHAGSRTKWNFENNDRLPNRFPNVSAAHSFCWFHEHTALYLLKLNDVSKPKHTEQSLKSKSTE